MIDIRQILNAIPHRYPFLLVDRIVEVDPGKSITAIKNVTINEPFFPGHFPGEPIMPGVLIIEAMAQAAAVMMLHDRPDREGKLVFFTGIDKARFRRTVVPGDQLRMTVSVQRSRPTACKFSGVAEVDGQKAAECEMMCAIVDRGTG